ncbi:xanthine dehydrogenase family protein molybdopterin-binding subunit [Orrella daihaiensis]|uniref:Xanthine dehydrogenase family protein molybdopterin-binding subunit n=1 Tax=Orrella daihaiensis TaxID=2782176 RepID=A0ABY4AKD8_9BURK|nr:xanthine dehydrogenase family protein molybdopterin-binding subunit [Orrella daihaiensis]UOD50732.1 xanthine dehydrogenase family protein molybdopterin-binding subunit [Orrella daihaiensis]
MQINHSDPQSKVQSATIFKLTRRQFLAGSAGALALGASFPALAQAGAQETVKPGSRVQAYLLIRPDNTVFLQSPFVEGGQGVNTAMAQIIGEELDMAPAQFTVQCAPPGPDYLVVGGRRFTGGSRSVRSSYDAMRQLGASARMMLMQAAAKQWGVAVDTLTTEPGVVVHVASNRKLAYGELAQAAFDLPLPTDAPLRSEQSFRWIGKPVPRIDVRDKSTGRAQYTIDLTVPDMVLAAVQHAPRLGLEPGDIANESPVRQMPGVISINRLPGAVAVVADQWWRANKAAQALQVTWQTPAEPKARRMPADFSSQAFARQLRDAAGPGMVAQSVGDVAKGLQAGRVVEAIYEAPFLAHGQLEPPSSIARFNADGTLDVWAPNQIPDGFRNIAAKAAGLPAEKVMVHSPPLGGFFGRQFLYEAALPLPQAVILAKELKRPVKVIWSREQEFLRDALRPYSLARFKAAIDEAGKVVAMDIEAVGEGPMGRVFGRKPDAADRSVVEGLNDRPYAIPNVRVSHVPVDMPPVIGFWRAVGHSMNEYFYETFLDEVAQAGQQDPYALRLALLADKPRHKHLLTELVNMAGGWQRGPFDASDGTRRARGLAMASAFGSEVAAMAEVSIDQGAVVVHDVWVAIDPGKVVNPAVIKQQVQSAVALGLSETLVESYVYENGEPQALNFDRYAILRPSQMPNVHVQIIESGAEMGGIGEPGLPAVPPAVANAVATLTGQRPRSLPLSQYKFEPLA